MIAVCQSFNNFVSWVHWIVDNPLLSLERIFRPSSRSFNQREASWFRFSAWPVHFPTSNSSSPNHAFRSVAISLEETCLLGCNFNEILFTLRGDAMTLPCAHPAKQEGCFEAKWPRQRWRKPRPSLSAPLSIDLPVCHCCSGRDFPRAPVSPLLSLVVFFAGSRMPEAPDGREVRGRYEDC